jgi:hypothetical protein
MAETEAGGEQAELPRAPGEAGELATPAPGNRSETADAGSVTGVRSPVGGLQTATNTETVTSAGQASGTTAKARQTQPGVSASPVDEPSRVADTPAAVIDSMKPKSTASAQAVLPQVAGEASEVATPAPGNRSETANATSVTGGRSPVGGLQTALNTETATPAD